MSEPLRAIVASVGIAGHALPAIAVARELHRRGHEVTVLSYERWRDVVEGAGMGFGGGEDDIVPAPESPEGVREDELALRARSVLEILRELDADVVVNDGLTLAPALAAEIERVPQVTLHPEIYPVSEPGLPVIPMGLYPPRTRLGAVAWRVLGPRIATRLFRSGWARRARRSMNASRALLGLPPAGGLYKPVSDGMHIVGTLPQLEYPRRWPENVHVTGPMLFDPPHPRTELPAGEEPLVFVAPSTVKDPERRLARASIEALADEPVRVLVTMSGADGELGSPLPGNATVVDWAAFGEVMPLASLVVCGGNHGTLTRALVEGTPVLVSPAMPDDAEHGARVAWAGAGLMIPARLLTPRALRLAARELLTAHRFAARAREIAAWGRDNDGAAAAAGLIEEWASPRR